ncbi:MAG: glycosyltransferase family 4 protein [Thiotrichaceae bacterium]
METAGGAEAQLYTLANALAARGHEIHFIVDESGQFQTSEVIGGITLHKTSLRYMGGSNLYLLLDWIHFMRLLWRIDASLHLIKVPRNLLLPLALFARLRSRKAIYIGQRDVDTTREGVLITDSRFAYWFYRWGLYMADAVVAQTEFQRKLFAQNFAKQATVIRNVVTLKEEAEVNKENYILWVGNSSYRKQPELVLELAKRLPDCRFKMIMALIGERSSDDFITNEASKLPNFEYIGFVPFHEIGRYYSKAKLLVSTSLSEGFPNTFLQAWQHGTPVVSLQVNPDNVIKAYNLGRVSSSMDILVGDIGQLMRDENRLIEMGESSRSYVNEFHSLKKSVDDYESLFGALEMP